MMSPELRDLLVQILTIGGPVALLAVMSQILSYKLSMYWMNQATAKFEKIDQSLGEVLEALRRFNGRARSK